MIIVGSNMDENQPFFVSRIVDQIKQKAKNLAIFLRLVLHYVLLFEYDQYEHDRQKFLQSFLFP